MNEEKPQIDTNALSRQLAVYGHEAQGKLMAMKVFIHGITGVLFCFIVARHLNRQEPHPGRPQASVHLRSQPGDHQ